MLPMKNALTVTLALLFSVCMHSSHAQPSGPTPSPEPQIQRTVIEDDGTVIEEMRVRGHTQRISVASKRSGVAPYEIILGDGSRDTSDGPDNSRGATGKRVWKLLSF